MKISILTLQCAVCLCGMLHTAEIVSEAYFTPLSPQWVAHHKDCLRGVMHTTEIDSAVCCTPPRSSLCKCTEIISGVCCTQRRFFEICSRSFQVCNTLRRASLRCATYRSVQHTVEMILRCYAHQRDWISGVQDTAEIILWSNILTKSKPNFKIL